ncbi:type II toxin-antitoxin system VapC family toxin [Acidithiobacillus ferrooxidans]|uniref:type II toxin-antitoxin system VapC family toxin n=1 Tax=Acidithiobacillus ferrooxidans TaxID=920 RepID=UPI002147B99B|nr:type II toxin-antitoxin system VapC family toxin [Acidithiobacillus ferrooxidans]MCR1344244.1 type II toxin-antitoxin system VapC family toxin [Acidithiobacillus ferrooxidans]MCR1354663.1 type II toxin-antitoxin system VapC family toxin [Acidithiobacillus ferrooxidans]
MTATQCVVDTSAWVEWLAGTALGAQVAEHFPDRPQWIVPTLVQFELSKWLLREVGEEEADQVIAFSQKCVVVSLDTRIALLAAELHREYKLATADAIVYATARHQGADLLTCDAHFEGLPGATLLAKTGRKD